jgi:leader peptidase (prepilin peptidase)/N-methyltransferase
MLPHLSPLAIPSPAAEALPYWGWIAIGVVLGAIAGSFLATLVVRWPRERTLSGRSACDGCGRALRAVHLVPLLSFVLLRGRCRNCGAPIDRHHPAIEAVAALIGGSALALAPGAEGLGGAVFGWLLLTLAMLDLEHFWLPDRLTATLAVLGLAGGLAGLAPPLADRIVGGLAGFAVLAAIGAAYSRLRGRIGLGQGDPKLLGAVGLWLGWQALPLVLLGASLAGLAAVAARAAAGKSVAATDRVPLGALMAIAAWLLWCVAATRL